MADNLRSKCNVDKPDEYMSAVKMLELQIQEIDSQTKKIVCTQSRN